MFHFISISPSGSSCRLQYALFCFGVPAKLVQSLQSLDNHLTDFLHHYSVKGNNEAEEIIMPSVYVCVCHPFHVFYQLTDVFRSVM
jgi:hypothetical protein